MIVLKHLANEYNLDPYKLRMMLRDKFGKRRRWRWDTANPQDKADLQNVEAFLKDAIETPTHTS